jgi:methylated-DNA-protein-cysteine methyltransferase-like protein
LIWTAQRFRSNATRSRTAWRFKLIVTRFRIAPAQSSKVRVVTSDEYASYYAVIRTIPQGRVMTYGDVAIASGHPRWARRVGYALSSLTDNTVPWWRVINAQGRISLGKARGHDAADLQRHLLEAEGVYVDLEGVIDLKAYRVMPGATKKGSPKAPL